jgi:positive regulator of sigma E activity
MTETAVIVSINNSIADVTCKESGGCKSCSGSSFCNVKSRTFQAAVPEKLQGIVKTGDLVEIYLPPGKTVFAGFVVLMVPLILFITGFLLGTRLLPSAGEGIHALFALAGLSAGFLLAMFYNRMRGGKNLPIILKSLT